jgi:hypothetical protein
MWPFDGFEFETPVINENYFAASPLHRQPDPIPPLSKDVALLKLEQKFKQAMSRIEELTSEKEHLVRIKWPKNEMLDMFLTQYKTSGAFYSLLSRCNFLQSIYVTGC